MDWISVNDELPNDRETVLIYTDEFENEYLEGCHVATFCRGRPNAEAVASGAFKWADEWGNNHRPFRWRGDGPCSWFGQEVTHWARIVPPRLQEG